MNRDLVNKFCAELELGIVRFFENNAASGNSDGDSILGGDLQVKKQILDSIEAIRAERNVEKAIKCLRSVVRLCLLEPRFSSIVVATVPELSFVIVLELLEEGFEDDFVVEKILLITRLAKDPRLHKKANSLINNLKQSEELVTRVDQILHKENDRATQYKTLTHLKFVKWFPVYRLSFLVFMSTNENYLGRLCKSILLREHSAAEFESLYFKLNFTGALSRLIAIEGYVSYKRIVKETEQSKYVKLDYSEDLLCKMLNGLDVSMGQVLIGDGGRCFYIKELGNRVGVSNDKIQRIYTDDATDVRTLIGNWICTENVGEFVFSYGILTIAMLEGNWLVFDENMSDGILSLLLDICTNQRLVIPELSKIIYPHENFNIFIVASAHNSKVQSLPIIYIPTPDINELTRIVLSHHPNLEPITGELIKHVYCEGVKVSKVLKFFKRLSFINFRFDGFLPSSIKSKIVSHYHAVFLAGITCQNTKHDLFSKFKQQIDEIRFINMSNVSPPAGSSPNPTGNHSSSEMVDSVIPGNIVPLERTTDRQADTTSVHKRVLDMLSVSHEMGERVLLVGETGTGKTSIVQKFAEMTGNRLLVYVFNEQSESVDLLGGYYPDSIIELSRCVLMDFMRYHLRACVLDECLSGVLSSVIDIYECGSYNRLLKILSVMIGNLLNEPFVIDIYGELDGLRRKCNLLSRGDDVKMLNQLKLNYLPKIVELDGERLNVYNDFVKRLKSNNKMQLKFKYEDGILVNAMKNGHWILLDEINLAPCDLLQRLYSIFEENNKFHLYECGNKVIEIHPNFRIFACMNPPVIKNNNIVTYSYGKKELPTNFRAKFTEIFIDPIIDYDDLIIVASSHVRDLMNSTNIPIGFICNVYIKLVQMSSEGLLEDGSLKSPTFTLRNFVRCLHYLKNVTTRNFKPIRNYNTAAHDAIHACFTSSLKPHSLVTIDHLLGEIMQKGVDLSSCPTRSSSDIPAQRGDSWRSDTDNLPSLTSLCTQSFGIAEGGGNSSVDYVNIEGYWMKVGGEELRECTDYILTDNIRMNLRKLTRILSGQRIPILLEGPTASGKTSLVKYLCDITGHKCIRINNHEHTEVSEYIGRFIFDNTHSKITFHYGPIINAMKYGHWVILDELNLASSQILEALNRILDDNREVYIPETREVVRSHPDFMIFATQNPSDGVYGGRKQLSRAFCNRFIQMYVDEISSSDLEFILHKRCKIAMSRSQKIVRVYRELMQSSLTSMIFEKSNVLTLRDLLKWSNRVALDDEGLPYYGWCIIAEKLRDEHEKSIVKGIIEKHCLSSRQDRVRLLEVNYKEDRALGNFLRNYGLTRGDLLRYNYTWFDSTDRVMALVLRALEHKEPILLIGETGIGKTTLCQLIATITNTQLNILNCHKHTEASDFIGSFRPIRRFKPFRQYLLDIINYLKTLNQNETTTDIINYLENFKHSNNNGAPDFPTEDSHPAENSLPTNPEGGKERYTGCERTVDVLPSDLDEFIGVLKLIRHVIKGQGSKRQRLNEGSYIMGVLNDLENHVNGALFEWVDGPLTHSMCNGEWFLADEISLADDAVLEKMNSALETDSFLSIPEAGGETLRTVSAHPNFRFFATMNPGNDYGKRELSPALLNRFTPIYIPKLEINNFQNLKQIVKLEDWIVKSMVDVIDLYNSHCTLENLTLRDVLAWYQYIRNNPDNVVKAFADGAHVSFLDKLERKFITTDDIYNILKAQLEGSAPTSSISMANFITETEEENISEDCTPSYCYNGNTSKVMRALSMDRAILLEGEPGVGKTASVEIISRMHRVRLIRINLSEHTDIMDLFGSDLPSVKEGKMQFSWHNGPLLESAEKGYWIVLDELNLASQQVLEGLNALLDHRRETFIPELNRFVKCHENFRVFATQNPARDGNGRKYLPKSFLNRFTRIYVHPFEYNELVNILQRKFPKIGREVVIKIIDELGRLKQFNSDWEWNLRDAMRFCHALDLNIPTDKFEDVFKLVILSRISDAKLLGKYVKNVKMPSIDIKLPPANNREILLFKQFDILHSLESATKLKLPILLTGAPLTGKVSIIRKFAQMNNRELEEMTLLPTSDLTDIIGSFEQTDEEFFENNIKACVDEILKLMLPKHLECDLLNMDLEELISTCNGDKDLKSLVRTLKDFQTARMNMTKSCNFRWINSTLISAIETGKWMLIRKIHDANPAILDRLNSLLEDEGQLLLNESGESRVVVPHADFRIFMTMDNRLMCKVSRAFRNRCLELSVSCNESANESPALSGLISKIMGDWDELRAFVQLNSGVDIDGWNISVSLMRFMDATRLVMSVKGQFYVEDAVIISLVNCIIQSFCRYRGGEFAVNEFVFLRKWSLWDVPIIEGFKHVSDLFPNEVKNVLYYIGVYFIQGTYHHELELIRDYIALAYNDFAHLLTREVYLVKLTLATHRPIPWYISRINNDEVLRLKLLREILSGDDAYNLSNVESHIGLIKCHLNSGYSLILLIKMLLDGLELNESSIIELSYYLHYLSKFPLNKTVEYIKHAALGMNGAMPLVDVGMKFTRSLYNLDDFRMELLWLYEYDNDISQLFVETDTNLTLNAAYEYINNRVLYLTGKTNFKQTKIRVNRASNPIIHYFNKRLNFITSWINHLYLTENISLDSSNLKIVHKYSMDIVKLYLTIQNDLSIYSLLLILEIIVDIQLLSQSCDHSYIYKINLDLHNLLIRDNSSSHLEPYLTSLDELDVQRDRMQVDITGSSLGSKQPRVKRKGDEGEGSVCYIRDVIGRLVGLKGCRASLDLSHSDYSEFQDMANFWTLLLSDNSLSNFENNFNRIHVMEFLMKKTVDSTASNNLFILLCYISPVFNNLYNFDLERLARELYRGIIGGKLPSNFVCSVPDDENPINLASRRLLKGLYDYNEREIARSATLFILHTLPNLDFTLHNLQRHWKASFNQTLINDIKQEKLCYSSLDSLADGDCKVRINFDSMISSLENENAGHMLSLKSVDYSLNGSSLSCSDFISLVDELKADILKFVGLNGVDAGTESLTNFANYISKRYLLLNEIIKPILFSVYNLIFILRQSGEKLSRRSSLRFPYNPPSTLSAKQLISLTLCFYEKDIYHYTACVIYWYSIFNFKHLVIPSYEPIKHLFVLISGIAAKARKDDENAQEFKMNTLQKCLASARRDTNIAELSTDNEIIYAILDEDPSVDIWDASSRPTDSSPHLTSEGESASRRVPSELSPSDAKGKHSDEEEEGCKDVASINVLSNLLIEVFACGKVDNSVLMSTMYYLKLNGYEVEDDPLIKNCLMKLTRDLNGYKDPDNHKIESWNVIRNIDNFVNRLLQEFNNHPQLLDIQRTVFRISRVDVCELGDSVLIFLLELLDLRMQRWNEYAHSNISLKPLCDDLEDLILRLRRKELGKWSRLIQEHYEKCQTQASSFLVYFIEMISNVYDSTGPKFTHELYKFVLSLHISQFKPTLHVIHTILKLFKDTKDVEELSRCTILRNMYEFLSYWNECVESEIAELMNSSNEKINEIIKLVKWNGPDFIAIKESINTNRKQVMAIVKHFDESIKTTFESLYYSKIAKTEIKFSAQVNSELALALKRNAEHVRENKESITRPECKAICRDICDLLSDSGYRRSKYVEDIFMMVRFDRCFGLNDPSIEEHVKCIMMTLHVLLNSYAGRNEEFRKVVDMKLFEYLSYMLEEAQGQIINYSRECERARIMKFKRMIESEEHYLLKDNKVFTRVFQKVDELHEGILQHSAATSDDLGNLIDLLSTLISYISNSPEYILHQSSIIIGARWKWISDIWDFIVKARSLIDGLGLLITSISKFYNKILNELGNLVGEILSTNKVDASFHPIEGCEGSYLQERTGPQMEDSTSATTPINLPMECLHLSIFISTLCSIEFVKDEDTEGGESTEFVSGTGFDEGTAIRNISEDIKDYDEDLLDADKNEASAHQENDPGLDIDLDFEGDEYSLDEVDGDGEIKDEEGSVGEIPENVQDELDGECTEMDDASDRFGSTVDGNDLTRDDGNNLTEGNPEGNDCLPEDSDPTDNRPQEDEDAAQDEESQPVEEGEDNEIIDDTCVDSEEADAFKDAEQIQGDEPQEDPKIQSDKTKDYDTAYGVEGDSDSVIRNEEEGAGVSMDMEGVGVNENLESLMNMIERLTPYVSQQDITMEEILNEFKRQNIVQGSSEDVDDYEDRNGLNVLDDNTNRYAVAPGQSQPYPNKFEDEPQPYSDTGASHLVEGVREEEASGSKGQHEKPDETEPLRYENEPTEEGDEIDTTNIYYGSMDIDYEPAAPESTPTNKTKHAKQSLQWKLYREETRSISTKLTEQIRIILSPTLYGGMQGDYKTGRRISMRKLMCFIASNYQRDKIWLRRTKPTKRDYCILLAIDNSKSMANINAQHLAIKTLVATYEALNTLNIGNLKICKFGGDPPEVLLDMCDNVTNNVLDKLTFDEETKYSHETGLPQLFNFVLSTTELKVERKIVIILSDGKFNKAKAKPWIQMTLNNNIIPLLVILDPNTSNNKSILNMKHVTNINGKIVIETFFHNFPFPYYAIIHDIAKLPNIVTDLLRLVIDSPRLHINIDNGSLSRIDYRRIFNTKIIYLIHINIHDQLPAYQQTPRDVASWCPAIEDSKNKRSLGMEDDISFVFRSTLLASGRNYYACKCNVRCGITDVVMVLRI